MRITQMEHAASSRSCGDMAIHKMDNVDNIQNGKDVSENVAKENELKGDEDSKIAAVYNSENGAAEENDKDSCEEEKDGDKLPKPKHTIFPEEHVNLKWKSLVEAGTGLYNWGNTCFVNATLQCLTHTAPLVNYLLDEEHQDQHQKHCTMQGFCMLCVMAGHMFQSFKHINKVIAPIGVVGNLPNIASHMSWMVQEDAHEFLRFVVDKMQTASMHGHQELDVLSKETTAIDQIFGGYLRNKVECYKCTHASSSFEHFMDISLNVNEVASLKAALRSSIEEELLEGFNCPNCKETACTKRSTIEAAPKVLTIHLKRFDCNGEKLDHDVKFAGNINLRPFMTKTNAEPVRYKLHAVLAHYGESAHEGHYVACISNDHGEWHFMNDMEVLPITLQLVKQMQAYVLFYTRVIQ